MVTNEKPVDGGKRLRSSYVSSVLSISLVLFMMGLLGLLVIDAKKISDYVKEHVQLNIYLSDDMTKSELSGMIKSMKELPYVRTLQYISKDEALENLKSDLGEESVGMLDSNPLPATIDVGVYADYAHPDSLNKIQKELSSFRQVVEVSYQRSEVEALNRNFRTLAVIILIFCGLLLFIAVVLINNTIRLSLFSRRFLIKSMQLVGATKGFIRKPFLTRSLVHGFYSGLISVVLLAGIIYIIESRFPDFGQLSDLRQIGVLFASVMLFGFLISGLSTFRAVNRYLRHKADELY